jgi:DNA replication and repair protein RecF
MSPPVLVRSLSLRNLRAYASLDLRLEPGPQLIWGPNATGKTTLLEAVTLLAQGRSHRTSTDAELVRWGADYMRVEGVVGELAGKGEGSERRGESPEPDGTESLTAATAEATRLELTLQTGGRKRIVVNGVPRRPAALADHFRTVLFAPEEMLLVIGQPALRRTALDALAGPHDRAYASNLATYGRALAQRNSLLRQIRDEGGDRAQLRYWDEPFLAAGAAVVIARHHVLEMLAGPLAAAHAEIAPEEERVALEYATNAPQRAGESPREALARRLAETADKEVWNGTTLVGPHRDDLVFRLGGRDMSTFASRGQQRTAILALKLAELDLLSAVDGRPPVLLLDDVFSELDPLRRGHLVRRIAELPQALVTTTALGDLDPDLRRKARRWQVVAGEGGTRLEEG